MPKIYTLYFLKNYGKSKYLILTINTLENLFYGKFCRWMLFEKSSVKIQLKFKPTFSVISFFWLKIRKKLLTLTKKLNEKRKFKEKN